MADECSSLWHTDGFQSAGDVESHLYVEGQSHAAGLLLLFLVIVGLQKL